ncbi:hypothetical protein M199_gp159 [Halogranum tailed virus 1]|uniref:Uncharacterized protein n=1 Tax=Halogranum tailed virus 1 TaxID=1273749 RepID=R4TLE5_9CAUD|nr:hypothetical protein M199_gp159 [Halogranum tailed virus 1]AGM11507.1 hypothetical protein HGTV1_210 [Halogranum tailed virus 1]
MGSSYVWKVERWLDKGFVLQQKYEANTSRRSGVKEVKGPAYQETDDSSRYNQEYEEVFRIVHISEIGSIDREEVEAKAVEHIGNEVLKDD